MLLKFYVRSALHQAEQTLTRRIVGAIPADVLERIPVAPWMSYTPKPIPLQAIPTIRSRERATILRQRLRIASSTSLRSARYGLIALSVAVLVAALVQLTQLPLPPP